MTKRISRQRQDEMRIGLISTSQVPSRTANSMELMKVCQALTDLGHSISLWLPERVPADAAAGQLNWAELLPLYGIRDPFPIQTIRMVHGLRGYDFSWKAVMAAKQWGSDLLYVWPYQAAAIASRLRLPTLLELHDEPPAPQGQRLFRVFMSGKGALRVLPTTRALEERVEQLAGKPFPPGFSVISPNGVDLDKYAHLPAPEVAREILGWEQSFTVGYTGHLYEGRGLNLLLELARQNPGMRFVWAGGEPEAVAAWQQKLRAAGVSNTLLPGFVPNEDLPGIQAGCDVLVMPYARRISVSSGGDTARYASPMKVFEYMAAGRLIMSSDLPVIREVLNEENALLLPPEDVAAWDRALNSIRLDDVRRQGIARRAGEDALRYSWRAREQHALAGLEARDQDGK